METVPAHLAALALGDLSPAERRALSSCGRRLGERVEVDLGLVAEHLGAGAAERVRSYQEACTRFWDTYEAGGRPGEYVAVRREVFRDKQRDTKSEKRFLTPQIEAMDEVPGLGEYVTELLRAEPDEEVLNRLGGPFHAKVTQDGHWRTVELLVEGTFSWPPGLGGAADRSEVRRALRLVTSHAKSKGRHSERRLVEVVVSAEELWPRPRS